MGSCPWWQQHPSVLWRENMHMITTRTKENSGLIRWSLRGLFFWGKKRKMMACWWCLCNLIGWDLMCSFFILGFQIAHKWCRLNIHNARSPDYCKKRECVQFNTWWKINANSDGVVAMRYSIIIGLCQTYLHLWQHFLMSPPWNKSWEGINQVNPIGFGRHLVMKLWKMSELMNK